MPQQLGNDVGDVARDDPFRANFIRLKMQHELYVQKTNGVTLLTPTVFRAEIPLPAEAPIGNYDVDVKVFADGALLTRANSAFEIIKVGFEQFVANAAQDYGLLYGITTAMMAIMTGWFAAVVFRRDLTRSIRQAMLSGDGINPLLAEHMRGKRQSGEHLREGAVDAH